MAEIRLKLVSAEGITYEVEENVACQAQLIKNMVEDAGPSEEIPLPNVKSEILCKVIEYLRYYIDRIPPVIAKPLKSAVFDEVVPQWDAAFIELEQETLFELLLASNYLDIKPLLDLACAKVASMVKGKTTEELRRHFNIENDFAIDEEYQIKEENKWAELD